MSAHLIGSRLDELGVEADLESSEMLVDCIVVGKVIGLEDHDGVRLIISSPQQTDWITKIGLLRAALALVSSGLEPIEGDD